MRCASCREVFFASPHGADEDAFGDDDMDFDPDDPVAASLARRMGRGGRELSVDASSGSGAQAGRSPASAAPTARRPDFGALSRRVAQAARGLPLTLILAVVLVGGALGALLGRESVVRTAPTAALLYELAGMPVNLRGLELVEVTSGRGLEEGGEILTVEGVIANRTDRSHMVPPVSVILRDEQGRPLYAWDVQAPRATLHPGENVPFRARLVAPPPEARQVLVRFSPALGVAGGAD